MTAEPRRRRSWAAWIAVALVLLPVLYMASVGPVNWVLDKAGVEHDGWLFRTLDTFYAPLSYAAAMTRTDGLLLTYIGWFVDIGET